MYELTTPQQNIWNLQKYYEGTSISNICGAVFFEKECDHQLLNQAINKLLESQSGMRLRFREASGIAVQTVAPFTEEKFPSVSFENQQAFDQFAREYAMVPFDLIDQPLYRFTIFDIDNKSGILLCTDHLISDAWSFSIMANTVCAYYEELCGIGIAAVQAGDYSAFIAAEQKYLTSSRYEKDRAYWAEQYTAHPEISYIKPNSASVVAPTAKRYTTHVTAELSKKIDRFSEETEISQAVLFEASVIAYLSRINSDNKNISIGVPVLNRSNAAEKQAVGMFISTTPLTVSVSGEDSMKELCQNITAQQFSLFRHQRYPYSHILRDLHEKYNFSGNLYDVIVSFQNAQTETNTKTQWLSNGYCEVGMEFHIDNRDHADRYMLNIDYQTELFHQDEEIGLLVNRILSIIEQIINNPSVQLKQLEILTDIERQLVITDFNDTAIPFPKEKCVHELFQEQVERIPEQVAVVFEGQSFTYRQIDEMSNSLAHLLRSRGIGRGDIIPIVAKRSHLILVAMFGILKAGAAYMPVDPTYPKDRMDYMFEDAQAKLALTLGYSGALDIESIDLEKVDFSSEISPLDNANEPEDLCYIIFTSGSTGRPKGVMLPHRTVVNYSDNNKYNVSHVIIKPEYHSIVSVTNIVFDIFVTESILPLLNGLTIYFASEDQCFRQAALAKLIQQNHVDVIQTTPTKMRSYLLDKDNLGYLKSLKAIVMGGEAFPLDLYGELKQETDAEIFNIYGPAETTVWSTNAKVNSADITIGSPIANTQVYILDSKQAPLPIGVAGELCISGEGVGKGYLNRPDLTAERFLPNPFIPGTTMYRTGDLARWRADGEIEYLGRMDTQVKIRGLRIELGEIESVMAAFEGIQLVAVTDKRDEQGRQYLVGYYTSKAQIDEKALRQSLAAKLPKYMVPNYFVHLDEMPMTASGKTDRKNLPAPDFSEQARVYVAPESPTEQTVSKIWEELLKIEQISKTDDFFELGGDSLVAIHLLAKLEDAFEVVITVKDIMEYSVLEELAAFIDQAESATKEILPTGKTQYPLLPQQMAIYAVCSKQPDTLTYNMPARMKLPVDIDREKLCVCVKKLSELHPELKTCIKLLEGTPCAIFDEEAELNVEVVDSEDGFVRPFDLAVAPLARVSMTKDVLLFDMHHIIADGTSLSIILRDLAKLYNGQKVTSAAVTYADYAAYFHSADFTEHKEYFKGMLKCDFEPMVLPEKKHRDADKGISKFYQMDKSIYEKAKQFAKRNKLTDTMLFLGAFGILLSKYTGRQDVLSSIILTNRIHKETTDAVGMFANTLPFMLPVQGTTEEYLGGVRELIMNLFNYQELPFFSIAEAVGMHDKNVVNTSFVYQAGGTKLLQVDTTSSNIETTDTHTTKFDLLFEITPNEKGCIVRIEYNIEKYEQSLIDSLFAAFVRIIEQMRDGGIDISDINVMPFGELQTLLYGFNDTEVNYAKEKCVHTLFEEQAAKTPDNIAVVACNGSVTYRELNETANRIAHCLIGKGIKPNDIVAFKLPRNRDLISVLLGILKAGGCYMPIDPDYPQDRIDFMLNDSAAKLCITEDTISELLENEDATNPEIQMSPNCRCYCIYTSGSTGIPKGVLIKHQNIVNLVLDASLNECYMHTRHIAWMTTITFDVASQEIISTLIYGRCGYLFLPKNRLTVTEVIDSIVNNNIEVMYATPSYFNAITQNDVDANRLLASLKYVVLAGEKFYLNNIVQSSSRCPNVHFINQYGPAETHVVTYTEITYGASVSIGKPIANTQIYILDNSGHPVPIGVTGELCIAGDCVGAGYLNRPDLTMEKFVENPFGEGCMYKTGDLAYWREDGNITYVGRNDFQVKIRGLRIELGEIESIVCQDENVSQAVVVVRKDENGRQLICAFYTEKAPTDLSQIRNRIKDTLPRYMMPHIFTVLPEMPMTSSGKINRRALPEIDLHKIMYNSEYNRPETEMEKTLALIMEEVLQFTPVGRDDDFFELGGDSLKAIEFVSKAHSSGIYFNLQKLFDNPSVKKLSECIEREDKQCVTYCIEDFSAMHKLLSKKSLDTTPPKLPVGDILLTGATGFLGIHILSSFIEAENGKAYCIVRGESEEKAITRMTDTLEYYFGDRYRELIGKRIIVLNGDTTKESFGMVDLPRVSMVINAAATVKHYGSYQYFYDTNVNGTYNAIQIAKTQKAKFLHISTTGVSGNSLGDVLNTGHCDNHKVFSESNLFIEQPLDNVYIRSKFEAEKEVYAAMLHGLKANVVRVGNLTNRGSDLKFQPNFDSNAFLLRLKAFMEMGMLPDYLVDSHLEFSPVDDTANAIIKIAQHFNDTNVVFHANNPKYLHLFSFIELCKKLSIPMKIAAGAEFAHILSELSKNPKTQYIYEALITDMDKDGKPVYDSNIYLDNSFTVQYLRKIGFEWSEIDFEYIKGYITYFRDLGYLEV